MEGFGGINCNMNVIKGSPLLENVVRPYPVRAVLANHVHIPYVCECTCTHVTVAVTCVGAAHASASSNPRKFYPRKSL